MGEYIEAGILGLVQGLTEFLPVSSTGHMIIADHLMKITYEHIDTFEVVVQLGSILAVVVLYWQRFIGLLQTKPTSAFSGPRGIFLLLLTCLPAVLVGLVAGPFIKTHLFNPLSVALALGVGALFILAVEGKHTQPKYASVDSITPALALGIGCFQCLALWPGFSRSTSTIMGGLLLGAQREVATEYSFLAAVPIMIAASGYKLMQSASTLSMADMPFFLVGTTVAFLSSLLAIKVLLKIIATISFRPFAWYRLAIAPLVYYWFAV